MYLCVCLCICVSVFLCHVQRLKFTESDRLLVQIQAYLDNVFDVGALLEDAETKNALLEHMEELQDHNAQVIMWPLCTNKNVYKSTHLLCQLYIDVLHLGKLVHAFVVFE